MEKIKKNQKMRLAKPKGISQQLLLILLLGLCIDFAFIYCSRAQATSESNETMYVSVFLVPGQTVRLVTNVHLDFDSLMTGPSVNTTAFTNEFIGAKCELIREAKKCVLYFEISHSSVIGETLANASADVIAQEFLSAFGYTGLTNINEFQNTTGTTIITRKTFGYLGYTIQNVALFLKYKPANGCFAKLINERLLSKYVVADDPLSAIHPTYILKKNADSSFSWSFRIVAITSEILPSTDYVGLIDVKELLNSNTSIVETPDQHTAIIITIENITSWSGKTYIIDIKNIQPEGYVIQDSEFWTNSVDIKYEPLSSPIENITVVISIHSPTSDQNFLIKIGIAIAVSAIIIAAFFFVLKRKKEVRCNDEKTSKR